MNLFAVFKDSFEDLSEIEIEIIRKIFGLDSEKLQKIEIQKLFNVNDRKIRSIQKKLFSNLRTKGYNELVESILEVINYEITNNKVVLESELLEIIKTDPDSSLELNSNWVYFFSLVLKNIKSYVTINDYFYRFYYLEKNYISESMAVYQYVRQHNFVSIEDIIKYFQFSLEDLEKLLKINCKLIKRGNYIIDCGRNKKNPQIILSILELFNDFKTPLSTYTIYQKISQEFCELEIQALKRILRDSKYFTAVKAHTFVPSEWKFAKSKTNFELIKECLQQKSCDIEEITDYLKKFRNRTKKNKVKIMLDRKEFIKIGDMYSLKSLK